MIRNLVLCVHVSVLLLVLQQVHSQDACERITTADLGNPDTLTAGDGLLSSILTPGGESTGMGTVQVRIRNMNIVCEAQHRMRNRYRYTSVVVSFNCFSTDGRVTQCTDGSMVHTEQFDLGCVGGDWSPNILTISNAARSANPNATLSTELDSDCILCINPTNPEAAFLPEPGSIDSVTHCLDCDNCPMGLERCYGTATSQVCCVYFHNDVCVEQCPPGFAPNDQFVCELQCPELTVPNGVLNYTNQRLVGGVARLTCIEGYEALRSPATCVAGAAWSQTPACNLIQCSDVLALANGAFSYSDESRVVGTVATYECNPEYYLRGDSMRTCTVDKTWVPTAPTCRLCSLAIPDCVQCEVDPAKSSEPICTACKDGFTFDPSDGKCTTNSTPEPQTSSCNTACIIGIVLAILAVIVIATVVAIVAFVLYKYLNDPATKLAKTDTGGLNGVARDNPLYVDPAAVTEDGLDGVATETTPLEA